MHRGLDHTPPTSFSVYDRHLFTSESVTEGHPDKVADAISDAILDAILTDDPGARVACEIFVTTGLACVAGEITTTTYVPVPDIARRSRASATTIRRRGSTRIRGDQHHRRIARHRRGRGHRAAPAIRG